MFFRHVYETGLAQASYVIGCQATGEALVIDPKRDVEVYLEIAHQENLHITHITETHIHADFLSGTRELAALTGAKVFLSAEGGPDWTYQFDNTPLKDGSSFMVGNLKVDVMHTPGHTPEHICFMVTDTPASPKPLMFFTGDFVFVGDVGRPDLLEKAAGVTGTMEAGARQLFYSLRRFKALPDYIQVWPGHGAGSACGKALGAVPSTTVGYEKLVNWALQVDNEEDFVRLILEGQPEPPKYFAMMKHLNKVGPNLLSQRHSIPEIEYRDLRKAMSDNVLIVDTRGKLAFAGGHIPGSINIQHNSSFSTWAGWMIRYDQPFVLIAHPSEVHDIWLKLIRIGIDNCIGYYADLEAYVSAGHDLEVLQQVSALDASALLSQGKVSILDVRGVTEHEEEAIEPSVQIHAGMLAEHMGELSFDRPVVVHCRGGDRSSLATSYLVAHGHKNVMNMIGGINAWKEAGLPVVKG